MNAQQDPTVHLGVPLPRFALQEHTQMPLAIDGLRTVQTVLVGVTVKDMETQGQQINVMPAITVPLDSKCGTPMVLSAFWGISVLWVQKNLCDVRVERTKILLIKFLAKYVRRSSTVTIALPL